MIFTDILENDLCVQILVQYGAAVNRTDRNGCTPLYKAAYHGRPVLVDMLVKAGIRHSCKSFLPENSDKYLDSHGWEGRRRRTLRLGRRRRNSIRSV